MTSGCEAVGSSPNRVVGVDDPEVIVVATDDCEAVVLLSRTENGAFEYEVGKEMETT